MLAAIFPASQWHFLANKHAVLAGCSAFWPVYCIFLHKKTRTHCTAERPFCSWSLFCGFLEKRTLTGGRWLSWGGGGGHLHIITSSFSNDTFGFAALGWNIIQIVKQFYIVLCPSAYAKCSLTLCMYAMLRSMTPESLCVGASFQFLQMPGGILKFWGCVLSFFLGGKIILIL